MSTESDSAVMLGTFRLDDDKPADPEIVLTNCRDTALLGRLVTVFSENPDIRFFLIIDDTQAFDPAKDYYFVKDGSNWVLGSEDIFVEVLFDDTNFNPNGSEETFAIMQNDVGDYSIVTGQTTDIPDDILVDMDQEDIFSEPTIAFDEADTEHLFIDPSVLADGENEIIVNNFRLGNDILEFPDGVSVKDVVMDDNADFTDVIVGDISDNSGESDIVVRLLGVCQADLPAPEYGADADSLAEELINQLVNSGINLD